MSARDTAPQPGRTSSNAKPASQTGSAAGAVSPWTDQREKFGLNTLVRVIDLAADRQEFILLHPKDWRDLRDLEFDGDTVILPKADRTNAEIAEIVQRFDALYWADENNKQTRHSVLDRERYLTN